MFSVPIHFGLYCWYLAVSRLSKSELAFPYSISRYCIWNPVECGFVDRECNRKCDLLRFFVHTIGLYGLLKCVVELIFHLFWKVVFEIFFHLAIARVWISHFESGVRPFERYHQVCQCLKTIFQARQKTMIMSTRRGRSINKQQLSSQNSRGQHNFAGWGSQFKSLTRTFGLT